MNEDTVGFDRDSCLELVRAALAEDVRTGDVTSEAVLDQGVDISASVVAKEAGTIAGMPVAEMVFAEVDRSLVFEAVVADGEKASPGQRLAIVEGPARSLLTAERTALNFLQQLSGVATAAARLVDVASKYGVKIKDTRKTVPGLRSLQKYAARTGGCANHREGLWDQILIKDNHLACVGGERIAAIGLTVSAAKEKKPELAVEVEVEDIEEFDAAAAAGADIIMLDNVDPSVVREAVAHAKGLSGKRPIIEVSGGITLANLESVARERPDWISIGSITHSSLALDISLEF